MPIQHLSSTSWRPNGSRRIVRRRLVINRHTTPTRTAKVPQAPRAPRERHSPRHTVAWIFRKQTLKWLAIFLLAGTISFAIFVFSITRDLPDPNQLINRQVAQTTKIYDRTGNNLLYEIHGDQKRTLVQLSDIPTNVQNATIAIEDKNFYKHGAISIWSMFRTLVTDVVFHRSAGGSTLTQQFIKNAVLSNEKTFARKVKEIVLALRLEKKFSKDEILQMYLNEIPYGSSAYGVEAASQKYFQKPVKDVDLAEAAILAALPQAPSRYSPYGPNKQALLDRQKTVLDLMADQGYITPAERDAAKKEEVKFAPPESDMLAPHFVMYVKDILSQKYGDVEVEQGGLKVITTLDLDKQKMAEAAVKNVTTNYIQKYNASNAALVSIDPKTGQILAMVGSRDYFNDSIDGQVNVATSLRQPGSSIKPIVYATLFNKGYTPDTILDDVVTNFSTNGTPYTPHDYDSKERGPVTIRQALAGSLNIPAVEAIYLAGIKDVISLADTLGYTSLTDPNRYGLSLVLGGGEVQLLEHTNAFSAFAREGEISPIASILKVEDKDGNTLEEYKDHKKTVLTSQVAREITSILSDNNARTYIFGAKNHLILPDRPVAAKTGTTNDFKDAWTIGYTPSLVTGVWVGNNNNKAMKTGADGSILAAPIWNQYMENALAGTPVEQFNTPDNYHTGKPILDGDTGLNKVVLIDTRTNQLANSDTPPEFAKQETFNIPHSILYYIDKNNPLGPAPKDPNSDPQFSIWESSLIKWAKKNNLYSSTTVIGLEDAISPKIQPEFNVIQPTDGQIITDINFTPQIEITKIADNANVEYYINDNLVSKTSVAPFSLNKKLDFLDDGSYTLKVHVCDNYYNCTDKSIKFNLLLNSNQSPAELNLLTPTSGTTVTDSDFPVAIKLDTPDVNKITKVDIVTLDASNNKNVIKSLDFTTGETLDTTWDYKPDNPGDYKLYAEYYDWSGTVRKTNKISVTVK